MTIDKQDNLYAAGYFKNANGENYVSKWDGTNWTELSSIPLQASLYVSALVTDNHGNLYAVGAIADSQSQYNVHKWNGTSWSKVGNLNANDEILALHIDKNNNLLAGCAFINVKNMRYVAIWNGSNWSELSGTNSLKANDDIIAIISDAQGNVYAAGSFKNSANFNYVAKFTALMSSVGKIENEMFSVFPNPFSERFSLITPVIINEPFQIVVTDLMGRIVEMKDFHYSDSMVQTDNWSKGVYLLNIKSKEGNSLQTIRLIKSN
jgi:hypothetical protein